MRHKVLLKLEVVTITEHKGQRKDGEKWVDARMRTVHFRSIMSDNLVAPFVFPDSTDGIIKIMFSGLDPQDKFELGQIFPLEFNFNAAD